MSRAEFVLEAMRNAIDEQIAEEIDVRFREGRYTVHGLSPAQVKALADKFRRDTGLNPVKCSVEELLYDGSEK